MSNKGRHDTINVVVVFRATGRHALCSSSTSTVETPILLLIPTLDQHQHIRHYELHLFCSCCISLKRLRACVSTVLPESYMITLESSGMVCSCGGSHQQGEAPWFGLVWSRLSARPWRCGPWCMSSCLAGAWRAASSEMPLWHARCCAYVGHAPFWHSFIR